MIAVLTFLSVPLYPGGNCWGWVDGIALELAPRLTRSRTLLLVERIPKVGVSGGGRNGGNEDRGGCGGRALRVFGVDLVAVDAAATIFPVISFLFFFVEGFHADKLLGWGNETFVL